MDGRGAGVGEHREGEYRDGVQTRRRERHPPEHPHPGVPDDQAGDRARDELVGHQADNGGWTVVGDDALADQRDQQHGRCVVEPGLGLEGAAEPARQRHPPQHAEHRGSVGGRGHRTEQHGQLPLQAEQEVGEHGHGGDADPHSDRGQDAAEPDGRPHLGPAGGETAFGEDQGEGGEAERVGDRRVVELDAQPAFAQRDTHQQIDEKAGQAGAYRQPDGEDRGEQNGSPDEEIVVELLYRHTSPSASSADGAV